MPASGLVSAEQVGARFDATEALLGLAVGAAGGGLGSALLEEPIGRGVFLGALFGLAFGFFFARRATSGGAGLIWGLAAGFFAWLVLPAGLLPLFAGKGHSMAMLADARDQFPELVACLICLGMPVGVALGIRGGLRGSGNSPFHWGRAIVVGGFAGVLAGTIFSRWSAVGDFFPRDIVQTIDLK